MWKRFALLLATLLALCPGRAWALFPGMTQETLPYGSRTVTRFIDDNWCGAYYCFAFGTPRGGRYVAISPADPAHPDVAIGKLPKGQLEVVNLNTGHGAQPYESLAALYTEHPELGGMVPSVLAGDPDPSDPELFALLMLAASGLAGIVVFVVWRWAMRRTDLPVQASRSADSVARSIT